MIKTFAVFEGMRILKMSADKKELVEYLQSFPEEEKRKMFLAEKTNPTKEGESRVKQSGSKK